MPQSQTSWSSRPTTAKSFAGMIALSLVALAVGCKSAPPPAAPQMQAMPVMTQTVALTSVPRTETYVATIKSRRSSTLQPQVPGNLTKILVRSGDTVKAGQLLMQIDPLKQQAAVEAQQASELQQKAVYQYNESDLIRQVQLYKDGIISKQAYDQAMQAFQNAKSGVDAAAAQTKTQREQLAYYEIRAPYAGVVGDIPVHLGDSVSTSTVLTTVDEDKDLEAYIYIPTARAAEARTGLGVDLLDESGNVLAHTSLDFVSPEVDNDLQGILVKAPIPKAATRLRNSQIVNARITWGTAEQPTVPVLVVSHLADQNFVFLAVAGGPGFVAHQVSVKLGEPVGNVYPVLGGLNPGDRVILSGTQFLQEGMPVMPLSGTPPNAAAHAGN